jgi:hypothetical protein
MTIIISTLTEGQIYLFRQRSINSIGSGDWSDDVSIGQINLPATPATPNKIE